MGGCERPPALEIEGGGGGKEHGGAQVGMGGCRPDIIFSPRRGGFIYFY